MAGVTKEIKLEEFCLTVRLDRNDNILAIIREGDGANLINTNLPMGVYKSLAQKLEAKKVNEVKNQKPK
jgi:hypothetical protein